MPDNTKPKPSFRDAFLQKVKEASQTNDPLFDKQESFANLFKTAIEQTKDVKTAAQSIKEKIRPDYVGGTNTYDTLTERDYGIVPGQDQNEVRAWNQSTGEKIKYGVGKGLLTAAGSIVESTVGLADGLVEATVGGKGVEGLYDNAVGQGVDALNKWAQENMPHYYKKAEQNMGLMDRAFGDGTANFWSDKFLNGAGYFAGAYLTGLGLSKAFQIGKLATNGVKVFEAEQNLAKAVQLGYGTRIAEASKQLAVTAMMAHGESAMEARGIQESVRAKLESEGTYTPEEIDKIVEAAGNTGYAINLLLTGTTDFLQFGKTIAGGYNHTKRELNRITKNELGEYIVGKTTNKSIDRALRLGTGILEEGGQEGGQFITEKGAEDYFTRKYNVDGSANMNDVISSFVHGLEETFGTTDGLESMFLGAIMGGPSSVATGRGEYESRKERTERLVPLLNEFNQAINKKESAIRGLSYMNDMQASLAKGDIFAYKNAEYGQFKSYIQNVIDNGGYDLLLDKVDTLKGLEEEEFKKMFGFDEKQPLEKPKEQIIEEAKSKIKDINKIYQDINLRFPRINKDVRDVIFDAASSAEHLDKREKEVSTEIQKLTSEALLTQKFYNWSNDKFNNNTVFKTLEKDGEVQKDENGRFIELEKQGAPVSYEEFRKKAIDEYREEYNKKLEEVKSQMNPLDAQRLTELTKDLNKIADLRESHIKTFNDAITEQGQKKIQEKAEKAKKKAEEKLTKDVEKKISQREKEDKLKASKAKIEEIKDKAKKQKENKDSEVPEVSSDDAAALEAIMKNQNKGVVQNIPVSTSSPVKESAIPTNTTLFSEDDAPEGTLVIGGTPKKEEGLTVEEKAALESDKALNKTFIDGDYSIPTLQQIDEELTGEKESFEPIDNKGNTISPDGVIESVNRLIVPAAHAFSYYQREYDKEEYNKTGKYKNLNNDISSEMKEPMLLSHYEYQTGETLTLEIDRTFNITTVNNGVINYETLLEKEKAFNQKNLLIPIAIKNKNGKIVGYLHDINYINSEKVASKNNNLETQAKELKELRDLIVLNGTVNIEINSKGYGTLSRNSELGENRKPKKRTTSEALPDPTLKFAIGKDDGFYSGKDERLTLPEGASLINNVDTPIIRGAAYVIIPTPKNNQYFAARVDTTKLSEEIADTIISAIEANINKNVDIKNQIETHEELDIFTQDGLRKFISKFTLINSFSKDDVSDAKSTTKFFDISNKIIKFTEGKDKVYIIKDRQTFINNKERLREHLVNSYSAIYLKDLRDNKPLNYSIIKDGKVENKTFDSYTDCIKANTETNLNSYKISEDEYAYFDNPVITFKIDNTTKINKEQKTFSLISPENKTNIEDIDELKAKKADIERRRQEALKNAPYNYEEGDIVTESNAYGTYTLILENKNNTINLDGNKATEFTLKVIAKNIKTKFINTNADTVKVGQNYGNYVAENFLKYEIYQTKDSIKRKEDKINVEYDAELDALDKKYIKEKEEKVSSNTASVKLANQTIIANISNEDDIDYLPSSGLINEINEKYKHCF